jgi:hypothetical protein
LVTLLAASVYLLIILHGIDEMFDCQLTQSASLLSPKGKHTAIVFDIDCGATTGYNTQLSIASPDKPFDPALTSPVLVLHGKLTGTVLDWRHQTARGRA